MDTNNTPATPFSITIPPEFYQEIDRRINAAIAEAIGGNSKGSLKKSRYLTRKEVCELLSISLPTLSRYCSKGILLGQKVGNRILFEEARLQKSLRDLPVKTEGR